ncbi:MAG: hypothetical protein ACXWP5_01865 [Bdellovibrionota bacterium]
MFRATVLISLFLILGATQLAIADPGCPRKVLQDTYQRLRQGHEATEAQDRIQELAHGILPPEASNMYADAIALQIRRPDLPKIEAMKLLDASDYLPTAAFIRDELREEALELSDETKQLRQRHADIPDIHWSLTRDEIRLDEVTRTIQRIAGNLESGKLSYFELVSLSDTYVGEHGEPLLTAARDNFPFHIFLPTPRHLPISELNDFSPFGIHYVGLLKRKVRVPVDGSFGHLRSFYKHDIRHAQEIIRDWNTRTNRIIGHEKFLDIDMPIYAKSADPYVFMNELRKNAAIYRAFQSFRGSRTGLRKELLDLFWFDYFHEGTPFIYGLNSKGELIRLKELLVRDTDQIYKRILNPNDYQLNLTKRPDRKDVEDAITDFIGFVERASMP